MIFSNAKVNGFTLLELLIVVSILTILAVIVVVVINPSQILAESRDAQRISDSAAIKTAVPTYLLANSTTADLDGPNYTTSCSGEATQKVFVSVPSDNGETAPNDLPVGWSYSQVTSANLGKADGTGWLPINFNSGQVSPLSNLPIDPTNTFATGQYYMYTCSRSAGTYELDIKMSSAKYSQNGSSDKMTSDGGDNVGRYETGTSLTIGPPDYSHAVLNTSGLVGYWRLGEASGTTAADEMGTNNGTYVNTPTLGVAGALGDNDTAVSFPATTYMSHDTISFTGAFTWTAWVKQTYDASVRFWIKAGATNIFWGSANAKMFVRLIDGGSSDNSMAPPSNDVYHFISLQRTAADLVYWYIDGVQSAVRFGGAPQAGTVGLTQVGAGGGSFIFTLDEVAVYNAALTQSQITYLYNLGTSNQ